MGDSARATPILDTQLFRDAFNASPIGIAVENLDGQPLFVNPAFCRFLGFTEEEVRRKHCVDFSPKEDAEKDWTLFQQLRAGSIDHYQLEKRYFRRDGSLVWGRLSLSLLNSRPSPLVIAMVDDITDKKRAEEARFRHAAVIESSEDAIISKNRDAVITSWNAGAQRIFGYAESEVVGEPIAILIPPELQDEENKILEKLRSGERIEHYETIRVTKTGRKVDVSLSISPIKDSSGNIMGFSKIARDITKRKRAEHDLLSSEQRYRLLFERNVAGVGIASLDARLLDCNDGWVRILGYESKDELLGRHASEFYFNPAERKQLVDELFEKQVLFSRELQLRRKDGTPVWVLFNAAVHSDRDTPIVQATMIDISEWKRAEEALRASEERLRLAQQAARIGTFDWNIRTGVDTWTPELEAMYGLTPGGFGGTQTAFENLVHPDDRAGVIDLVDASLKTGQPANGEWRVVWRDGSVHWIAGRWQVFMDASGEPSRMIGVNIDVTERKRSEERLREYEEVVEGAEDIVGVIDREYRLLLANRQYLKMRNLTREQVVGHFVPEILGAEIFETVIKPKLDECFRGKVVRYEMKFSYPTVGERDLSLSYFPIEGLNGVDRAACILRDITERKRAEQLLYETNRALETQTAVLRSQEELLKIFVKNVPAGVAMLDREMRYLQVSERWCADYSVDASQVLGHSHYEIFPDIPQRWKEIYRRALAGETLRAEEDRWDREGGTTWLRWEIRPWQNHDRVQGGILIFAEDITHRKHAEEALLGMSRKLIEAHEQERTRIGRDLHDDVVQRLALLSIELEGVQQDVPDAASELRTRIGALRDQTTQITNDVQLLSHELHSSKLEYLGIVGAIKSFCKEYGERQKLEIDFKSDDLPAALPTDLSLSLFRVLQEALRNATKHSGVKHFKVRLWGSTGEIHLTVSDLGAGFDTETALKCTGLGLTSMQERLRLVGGELLINSQPKGGTTIHARVPLDSCSDSARAAG